MGIKTRQALPHLTDADANQETLPSVVSEWFPDLWWLPSNYLGLGVLDGVPHSYKDLRAVREACCIPAQLFNSTRFCVSWFSNATPKMVCSQSHCAHRLFSFHGNERGRGKNKTNRQTRVRQTAQWRVKHILYLSTNDVSLKRWRKYRECMK